jgi:methanogenic corrinoid protein MtbC1
VKKENRSYQELIRYEKEIKYDVVDYVLDSSKPLVRSVVTQLGENEINHMLNYHIKTLLCTLYFNNYSIFKHYHDWIIRTYHHRDIDKLFFLFLNEKIKEFCAKYITGGSSVNINSMYENIEIDFEDICNKALNVELCKNEDEKVESFTKVLLAGDSSKVTTLIKSESRDLDGFITFFDKVISHSLRKIGYLWEINEIGFAKEHLAIKTLEDSIQNIVKEFPKGEKNETHIFLCVAKAESHTFVSSVVKDVLKTLGFQVSLMSPKLEVSAINEAIEKFKPEFIIFNSAMQSNLVDLDKTISIVLKNKKLFSQNMLIGIAGGAFENIKNPASRFGVDFYVKNLKDFIELIKR